MAKSTGIGGDSEGTRVYRGSQWLAKLVRKYVAKKPDEKER